MAASGLTEVVSLAAKARRLYDKAHFERSLQKWRAALAAAEALGAENCVLIVLLKKEVVNALLACESARVGMRLSQAFVLEQLDQLRSCIRRDAATAPRRRHTAGGH